MTDHRGLTWRQFEDMMGGEERPRRRGMLPEMAAGYSGTQPPYGDTLKQHLAQMAAGVEPLSIYEQAAVAAGYKRIGDELVRPSLLEQDK